MQCPGTGVVLIGELVYGPEGLDGFVPHLFSAVHLPDEMACTSPDQPADGIFRANSIGLSKSLQFVGRFTAGTDESVMDRVRMVGFVKRGQDIIQACEDVAVTDFPLFYEKLVEYLTFVVPSQVESNGYSDVARALSESERPSNALVVVGGSHSFAARGARCKAVGLGDVCHSVVYDGAVVSPDAVAEAIRAGRGDEVLTVDGVSWLRQEVVVGD